MNLSELYIAYSLSQTSHPWSFTLNVINGYLVPETDVLLAIEAFVLSNEHLSYLEKSESILRNIEMFLTKGIYDGCYILIVNSSGHVDRAIPFTNSRVFHIFKKLILATNNVVVSEGIHLTSIHEVTDKVYYLNPQYAAHLAFLIYNRGYTHLILRPTIGERVIIQDMVTGLTIGTIPLDNKDLTISKLNKCTFGCNALVFSDVIPMYKLIQKEYGR